MISRPSPIAHLAILAATSVAAADVTGPLGSNLVVNGDAETGTIAGWVDGGIEIIESDAAGMDNLPPGVSIGDYSFTGRFGDAISQTLVQSIDLSALASQIDAGDITAFFTALIQSRAAGGTLDQGRATLEFFGDDLLDTQTFVDKSITENGEDWTLAEHQQLVPPGTRTAVITLDCSRIGGASTDAFFDNIALILTELPACPSDIDNSGTVDFNDLNILLDNWGLSPASQADGDIDGDGTVNFADLNELLDHWAQPCG